LFLPRLTEAEHQSKLSKLEKRDKALREKYGENYLLRGTFEKKLNRRKDGHNRKQSTNANNNW
jgi:hypothetical protein